MDDFQSIHVLNLHGDSRKGDVTPQGLPDENVFDIQQGVAIALFVRSAGAKPSSVSYRDLWGERAEKYSRLEGEKSGNEPWVILKPVQPYYFAVPKDFSGDEEYESFVPLTEVLVEQNTGVQTKRDELFIDIEKKALSARFQDIMQNSRDENYLKRTYWRVERSCRVC
jgi:predicted helicase